MALALPVIALSMSVGSANAASVESTVTAMEECDWQVAGIPTTITLTAEEKYVGDDLVVTSEVDDTIIVGLSGTVDPLTATSTASTECTFYNAELTAALSVSMSSTAVRATYPGDGGAPTEDALLSFSVDGENPFTINTTNVCDVEFVSPTTSALTNGTPTSLLSRDKTTLANEYGAGLAPRCSVEAGFSLTIPSITGVPAAPGADYSFTGGSVSFVFASE